MRPRQIWLAASAVLALAGAGTLARAQAGLDGSYAMTLTLVDGFNTQCRTIPNAERTLTISAGAVSMPYSPRGTPFKGTIAADGTITATTRSPTTGGTMNLAAKLVGGKITGVITADGGCRFDLKGGR
jgi:hypothetical protein